MPKRKATVPETMEQLEGRLQVLQGRKRHITELYQPGEYYISDDETRLEQLNPEIRKLQTQINQRKKRNARRDMADMQCRREEEKKGFEKDLKVGKDIVNLFYQSKGNINSSLTEEERRIFGQLVKKKY